MSTKEIIEDTKNNSSSSLLQSSSMTTDNENNLEEQFKEINCNSDNFFTPECNKFLLKKEIIERNDISNDEDNEDKYEYLYPNLNDKDFNIKIAKKKEFNDAKYEGPNFTKSIKEQSDILANADFELQPHQTFVKNFMSFQTPYSSLLLYHGLGSGKTCSAIGVCEEMRDYMKQMGTSKRIIIVASENVQDNFKLQLFDERKLKEVNGIWSMRGCVGNKLLKEINPMNMPLSKEKVISQIKNLINTHYVFLGYVQFANYIIKTMNYEEELIRIKEKRKISTPGDKKEKTHVQMLKDVKVELNSRVLRRLRNEFNNRLIVIDEVHNIRKSDDKEKKKVAIHLEYLVKAAENMRFLLLSATPMYNNYKEIIWLLNIMNTNDRRGRIDVKDVFDKNGNFKKNGEEILIRKATGYISFVRGENPYTFPYRVYPNEFAPENTFPNIKYPSFLMNLTKIKHEDKKRILSLYLTKIGECNNCGKCQYCCYKYILYNLRNKKFQVTTKYGVTRDMPSFENMEKFGYTILQTPLEALIISYPVPGLKSILDEIPSEPLSEQFSPSFSETTSTFDDEVEEKDDDDEEEKDDDDEVEEKDDDEVEEKDDDEEEEKDDDKEKEKLYNTNTSINKQTRFNPTHDVKYSNTKEKSITQKSDKTMIPTEETQKSDKTMIPTEETQKSDKTMVPTEETLKSDKTMIPTEEIDKYSPKVLNRSHQGLATTGGDKSSSSSSTPTSTNNNSSHYGIDPRQLTGKKGLDRMMNFLDSKSPPIKGEFEYKNTTIQNYGKIFSQSEIGKYSAKIKCILDKIYNREKNRVSDGIILIYSQYIDSGLIPVALALEEMGFTRYGQQGIKPLFKTRPSEVVDVRTMKPPEDKKQFMPARYSMITGDSRLSPNNDFEVKGITGEDNKNGHKVKVILISKAGAEGIDFKFIRQVHIIEPWYNMNRLEQIIGRAVRNFSHKDLPFEKRNVEIYMYGTILDKNVEEAVDLYIYRVAEHKAIQIGKVTRVLKETAVDCIINHDQNKFTQDIMNANLKEPIEQQLSSGITLHNFKVGDAPFSPSCDYMATCKYNCRPNEQIDESNLNEDTYDERFIIMNSEKILQRIRMLFKESFFYKKDMLLKSIRTPKEYPYVQIFSALTQLIEDDNEFIVDKYGRNGKLINIGDYYLFQPVELKNKNISIFDRSVPLDYKHNMIEFEVNKNIMNSVAKNILPENDGEKDILKHQEGKLIIDEMQSNYDITKEFLQLTKVTRGDDNWYKHSGIVMQKIENDYPESKKYLHYFLVAHMIELLLYEDKLNLMNYLYSLESINHDSIERYAKEYFENNSITTKDFTVFITFKLDKRIILVLDNNTWSDITTSTIVDSREVASSNETKKFLAFDKDTYNKTIGFMGYEKGNANLVFKTKNLDSKRDTGARCSEAGKAKNILKLNEIVGTEKYTSENTKSIGNFELCIITEFILRYFNEINKNNKKWFITPELAIYHKFYNV